MSLSQTVSAAVLAVPVLTGVWMATTPPAEVDLRPICSNGRVQVVEQPGQATQVRLLFDCVPDLPAWFIPVVESAPEPVPAPTDDASDEAQFNPLDLRAAPPMAVQFESGP